MRLGYVILYVEDVARSVDFYDRAFGLAAKFIHDSGDYAELDTGDTALAFSSRRLMSQLGKNPAVADAAHPSSEIALVSDDVAPAVARAIAAGADLIRPPQEMPWGQTIAYVADLDGFLVEICSPVGG